LEFQALETEYERITFNPEPWRPDNPAPFCRTSLMCEKPALLFLKKLQNVSR